MRWLIERLVEFRRLGELLRRDLPIEIAEAETHEWSSEKLTPIVDIVRRFLSLAVQITLTLSGMALFVLLFLGFAVAQHPINGSVVAICEYVLLILAVTGAILLRPVITIIPSLRRLPDQAYKETLVPVWLSLETYSLLINVGLLLYIAPMFSFAQTTPVLLLLIALWFTLPWLLFLRHKDKLFVQVRCAQLAILVLGALLLTASPVPMSHFQNWAQHRVAEKIRPLPQRELTSEWKQIEWFSQEGLPNIWYSSGVNGGYRLFAAPGFDPETNVELKSVASAQVRENIIKWFENEESRMRLKETDQRLRLALEARTERTATLVSAQFQQQRAERTILVFINGNYDAASSEFLAHSLSTAGVQTYANVFSAEFVRSPFFDELRQRSYHSTHLFNPADFCSQLLIIEAETTFEKLPQRADMLTARVVLTIQELVPDSGRLRHQSIINVSGAGFDQAGALRTALEHAEQKITNKIQEWLVTP